MHTYVICICVSVSVQVCMDVILRNVIYLLPDFSLARRAIIKLDWLAVGPRDASSQLSPASGIYHPTLLSFLDHHIVCIPFLPLPQRKI